MKVIGANFASKSVTVRWWLQHVRAMQTYSKFVDWLTLAL